jgi:hypothetical protein
MMHIFSYLPHTMTVESDSNFCDDYYAVQIGSCIFSFFAACTQYRATGRLINSSIGIISGLITANNLKITGYAINHQQEVTPARAEVDNRINNSEF